MTDVKTVMMSSTFNGQKVQMGTIENEEGVFAFWECEDTSQDCMTPMVQEDKGECSEDIIAFYIRSYKDIVRSIELQESSAMHVRLYELLREEDLYISRIGNCMHCGWEASLEGDMEEEMKWEAKLEIAEADLRRTHRHLRSMSYALTLDEDSSEEFPF